LHRQQRAFIIAVVLLLVFIYFGYRSHSTESISKIPEEFHREEINKEKEAWQQKQNQVDSNFEGKKK
jgi:hypothetical protein